MTVKAEQKAAMAALSEADDFHLTRGTAMTADKRAAYEVLLDRLQAASDRLEAAIRSEHV